MKQIVLYPLLSIASNIQVLTQQGKDDFCSNSNSTNNYSSSGSVSKNNLQSKS